MSDYHDPLAARLAKLLEQGSLTRRELSTQIQHRLRPLLDSGSLIKETTDRGSVRIVVRNSAAVEAFAKRLYPAGLRRPLQGLHTRSDALATRRSAKAGGMISAHSGILLRGFGQTRLVREDRTELPVACLTRTMGAAALVLSNRTEANDWRATGTIVTVENEDVFYQIERLIPEVSLAIWTSGNCSRLLLEWLKLQVKNGCTIVHAGDYDPVGLNEYLRLREAVGDAVSLFLPANLESLFEFYSDQSLLQKTNNQRLFDQVCRSSDPAVLQVARLMRDFGAGLEQEALLI